MNAAAQLTYLPSKQTEYYYEDGEWLFSGTYTDSYDANGNVVLEDFDDGETISRTENTWTRSGQLAMQLTSYSEDGGETFTNEGKRVQTYDLFMPTLTVSKVKYYWDEDNNAWVETGDAFRRTITRNEDGNVTSLVISVPYLGEYEDVQRFTMTYDPVTKQADTYRYDVLTRDEDTDDFVWTAELYLTNMKWKETNGQIVGEFSDFMSTGNYLQSATVNYVDEDGADMTGTITFNYDNEGGYTGLLEYPDELMKEQVSMHIDDANGSYTYEAIAYEDLDEDGELTDDDISSHDKEVSKYDSHGNQILFESYSMDEDEDELTLQESEKYDYTYDPAHGDAVKELIAYEYDYDEQEFSPMIKIVTDEYVAITSGIKNIKSEASEAANTSVYTLQGTKAGTSTANLPQGVYIVKNGGKAVKMIKK